MNLKRKVFAILIFIMLISALGDDVDLLSNTIYVYSKRRNTMLAIRLSAEIEDRLDALAKATGRTKTYYDREAILEYIDDLEDVYLAEKRMEEIKTLHKKTVPLEKVMKRHGMEG